MLRSKHRSKFRLAIGAAPLAMAAVILSCCVAPEPEPKPAPVAAPQPAAPTPTPSPTAQATPLTGDWTQWPTSAGEWIYRRDDRGSLALFGQRDQAAQLTLRCELPARRIFLTRASTANATMPLIIRTTSGLGSYTAQPTGGERLYVGIALSPNDMILDRIIYSRGRFLVEGGSAPLVVPSWPEIARVVEDCRS